MNEADLAAIQAILADLRNRFGSDDMSDAAAIQLAFDRLKAYAMAQMPSGSGEILGEKMGEAQAAAGASEQMQNAGYSAPGAFRDEEVLTAETSDFYQSPLLEAEARLAAEAQPEQFYQQHLARQGGLSQYAPSAAQFIEGMGPQAYNAYQLAPHSYGPDADLATTFREFLESGGAANTGPRQLQSQLQAVGDIYALGKDPILSEGEKQRQERMLDMSEAQIFNLAWSPYEQQLSPLLRRSARRSALRRFATQREEQPNVPFLQWLAGRQGDFFSGPVTATPAGPPLGIE